MTTTTFLGYLNLSRAEENSIWIARRGYSRKIINMKTGPTHKIHEIKCLTIKKVLFSLPDEDWQKIRQLKDSPTHVLCPISLKIALEKCMFDNDPRMAK